ncbi:hypothetical protein [Roseovarius sp. D0-M9]|uniref:hypothetical protein n=1 Tax=Roseovarius sp. D0-M9 TaxID=3127117 RepID=UPI0030102BB6
MMRDGCDFFEQVFQSVTMRCDVLLANVEIWHSETGEVVANYAGLDDLQAGLRFYTANHHPHMRQAIIAAEGAILLKMEEVPLG